MSLLTKILGRDDQKIIDELDGVRAKVQAWQTEFAALNDRVSKFEAEAETARATYFKTPTAESFDKLVAAVGKAKLSREVFSANSSVHEVRRVALIETEAVRALLVRACRIVHARLTALAGQHDADERTRCAMIGVDYAGCPTAEALNQKAARIDDELTRLANLSRACWQTERALASV